MRVRGFDDFNGGPQSFAVIRAQIGFCLFGVEMKEDNQPGVTQPQIDDPRRPALATPCHLEAGFAQPASALNQIASIRIGCQFQLKLP
jgi:hypothetical protein